MSQKKTKKPSKHNFLVPDTFTNGTNTYKKLEKLGEGGYAVCYKIMNVETNVIYAAKIIDKEKLSETTIEFLAKEIEIHKKLDHSGIVKYIENFEIDIPDSEQDSEKRNKKLIVIILELCGNSLSFELANKKKIKEKVAASYIKQIVIILKYLHENNIVHRDIKLSNILLSNNSDNEHNNTIKICDFGMSDYVHNISKKFCGTPNYMPPEIIAEKDITELIDVWSLGVALYAMLVGRPPFETTSVKTTYRLILEVNYYFPRGLSPDAKDLIKKMLTKTPQDRITLDGILAHPFITINTSSNNKIEPIIYPDKIIDSIYAQLSDPGPCDNPSIPPTWILGYRFVSKYGMFYKLTNGMFGACFNDNDIMITYNNDILLIKRKLKTKAIVKFNEINSYDRDTEKKMLLVKHYDKYTKLKIDPGNYNYVNHNNNDIHVFKWIKTDSAWLFRLTGEILQVIFSDDTSVVISKKGKVVTYITGTKQMKTLSTLHAFRDDELCVKLSYIRQLLRDILLNRKNNQK